MSTQDLRGMAQEELAAKLVELQESLLNMEIQHESQQLSNPVQLRFVRKDIARIQTVMNEQARAKAKAPEAKGDTK